VYFLHERAWGKVFKRLKLKNIWPDLKHKYS
jgi:uncharacterized membrane protein